MGRHLSLQEVRKLHKNRDMISWMEETGPLEKFERPCLVCTKPTTHNNGCCSADCFRIYKIAQKQSGSKVATSASIVGAVVKYAIMQHEQQATGNHVCNKCGKSVRRRFQEAHATMHRRKHGFSSKLPKAWRDMYFGNNTNGAII